LDNKILTADEIREHVALADGEVAAAQRAERKYSKMATTVAGIYINGDDCIAFNVGDSRVYRFRAYLNQISVDHSLGQNIITRCLGGSNAVPDVSEGIGRVFAGDIYILCTDGVWGVLNDDDFETALSGNIGTEETARMITDLAIERESTDNLSVIVIRRVN
jgi:protein phosphatase